MAGEYGVNIRMSVTGQEKLDQITKKTNELNASINKMKGINLSGNFPFTKGKDVKPLKDAKAQMMGFAKQVNQTGKALGLTIEQQEASLQGFNALRRSLTLGSKDFNTVTAAINTTTKAMAANDKQLRISQKLGANPRGNAAALKSGLVSGAFPLLFGQGPLGGAAGFAGGFAGTKIGGQMGGFAGGLAATAILQQLTEAIKGLNDLGKALDPKTLNIDTVSKSLGLLGTDTERYLKLIEQTQGKQAAYNAAVQETTKLVGQDGVEALQAFADSSQNLTNEMSKFFTRLGTEIAKLFNRGGKDDLSKPILGFERSNLLAQAKLETEDKEIMDLVKQRENANKNVARQLDDQIVKLMKAKNIEDARKKAAELTTMEYEQITKSLTDQIDFLNNAITLGQGEAEIIREKNKLIEAARKAGVEFDEAEIERQVRLKRELEKLNALYGSIASTIETGLVDAIEGAINGTKTLGDVARSVFAQIQRTLLQAGVNSLLSKLPGKLGKAFEGGAADGGPIKGGKTYLVGERGPELFTPGVSGTVTPNHALGGSTSVVVNVDASGSSVQSDGDGQQFGEALATAIQLEIIKQKRSGGLLS